jgi:hypothetical protein
MNAWQQLQSEGFKLVLKPCKSSAHAGLSIGFIENPQGVAIANTGKPATVETIMGQTRKFAEVVLRTRAAKAKAAQ